MAWTTPKTDFATGDLLTAAQMNAIGDNLSELRAGALNVATTTPLASDVTTTSSSFGDITGMSTSFTPRGTSIVVFYAGRLDMSSSEIAEVRIVAGAINSDVKDIEDGDSHSAIWRITGLTAGAAITIKAQFRRTGASGTAAAAAKGQLIIIDEDVYA